MQRTPDVNRGDVLRVVNREFPDDANEVLSILENITCSLIGADRLHLAHLKLSGGTLQKLREGLTIPDSRDVVSCAEYPAHNELGSALLDKMSPDKVQEIIDLDWQQYKTWLNAE
ncbi:hypothetical protein N9Y42_07865 [Mariniblastus sp.]|nr:hypothetical protein [Mariniblastus sp.]